MTSKNTDGFTIDIKNTQTDGSSQESIVHRAPCSYRQSKDSAYIVYKEDDVTCMIKADKNTVHVKRRGTYSSDVCYKENTPSDVLYKTPYGNMRMRIFTNLVRCSFDENGGSVHMEYVLEAGAGKLYNNMEINIKGKL